MNFKESKTRKNLAFAFAAECQAGARYQFIATQAQLDKFCFVKDTMKLLAKNEMAHAKLFYDYIVVNDGDATKIDFEAEYPYVQPAMNVSLKGEARIETDEFSRIYPEFSKIAMNEGFKEIAESFMLVAEVEQTHAAMLEFLNKNYLKDTLYKSNEKKVYRCSNCGHVEYAKEGWKKCPLCGMDQGYIMIDFSQEILQVAKEQAGEKPADEKKSNEKKSEKPKKK